MKIKKTDLETCKTVFSGAERMGQHPGYLNFGMIWAAVAAASIVNYAQHKNDRGDLVRAGLFLMMGAFYFWMYDRYKKK